jgi:hypothetical protein
MDEYYADSQFQQDRVPSPCAVLQALFHNNIGIATLERSHGIAQQSE